MSTQLTGAPLIKDNAKTFRAFGFRRCFPVSVARSCDGRQATGTILVGVGLGEAFRTGALGVLARLGELVGNGVAVTVGVAVTRGVGVIVAGLTPVELVGAGERVGSPGGGSSAAADPLELITTAITMITTISTAARITARRIQYVRAGSGPTGCSTVPMCRA